MDTLLETRPLIAANDRSLVEPSHRNFAGTYVPYAEPARLSSLDIVAGVLMAVMMIGPLAAAALGRMMT